MFWNLIASQRRIEKSIFFHSFSNIKNLVLSNGCEHVRIAFFFQKLTKIAQGRGALPPDPHSHRRLGAPPPDPRLWYA